ncbi:GFA family protein [Sphingomonas sp. DT-207]|uniref:GFA family protein n=1 Tax=Sphingomonas sp. DT-207 TaxID=3396167 RepID=UPI003F194E3D
MIEGSCHCGGVAFRLHAEITEFTTCDCSLCEMRGALMAKVPEGALEVIAGEDLLTLYQWNTHRARHYFCSRCGIYVFHRKRAAPDHFGVNARCLHDIDLTAVPVRATEGANMTVEQAEPRERWPGPRVTPG